MWWWDVLYVGTPHGDVRSANEIVLPAGRPAEVTVYGADVIHSFWVPGLAGKIDMIPGHVNRVVLRPREPGLYRGQCAEYCGAQHARMAFYVRVLEAGAFERWLAREAGPEPTGAVRGPDLTHVGSRASIAGWIASAQHLKPANRMPSFDRFDGPTLRALAAWLESLE